MDPQWINPLYTRESQPKGNDHMQSTAIKQVQDPELSLSAEVEQLAKGGWKRTIRASVRVFDGNHELLQDQLSGLLANGLDIAQQAIDDDYRAIMDREKETITDD